MKVYLSHRIKAWLWFAAIPATTWLSAYLWYVYPQPAWTVWPWGVTLTIAILAEIVMISVEAGNA